MNLLPGQDKWPPLPQSKGEEPEKGLEAASFYCKSLREDGRGHNGAWPLLPGHAPWMGKGEVEVGGRPGPNEEVHSVYEDLGAPANLGPWSTPFAEENWQPEGTALEAELLAKG